MEGLGQTLWERVQLYGIKSASLRDLLTLLLSRELGDIEANEKAAEALIRLYGPVRIHELSLGDLRDQAGLEDLEATRLLAAIQLGRKTALAGPGVATTIAGDAEASRLFREKLEGATTEHFIAAYLTAKGDLITTSIIHQGTLTATIVGPREVFREGVRCNAASVIVGHNHPSGDPEPSPEDIQITRTLKKAGELMDMPLLDHIILGRTDHVSLARRGYL